MFPAPPRYLIFVFGGLLITLLLISRSYSYGDPGDFVATGTPAGQATRLDEWTRYLGGSPGFNVFENLYYRDGVYYVRFQEGDDTFIPHEGIVSGESRILPMSSSDQAGLDDYLIILMNDGSDDQSTYYDWYYNFAAENILGAFAALAKYPSEHHIAPKPPSTDEALPPLDIGLWESDGKEQKLADGILFPWKANYYDWSGYSKMLVQALFGDNKLWPVELRFVTEQKSKEPSRWLLMERVVIVDRYAASVDPMVSGSTGWNKMAISILTTPPPPGGFFEPSRKTILDSLGVKYFKRSSPGRAIHRQPKIVYIDRQNTDRKLDMDDHQALVDFLEDLMRKGTAKFVQTSFGDMSRKEQIAVVADADVLIGIHGEGFSHELWMPEGGVVIEIFTPNSFLRNYQIVSQALRHEHIVVRDNRVLQRKEWEASPGEKNPEELNDGKPISLDRDFIEGLLDSAVKGLNP